MTEAILAAVEDLIFLSRIRQTGQHVGVSVELVDPNKLEERVTRSPVRAVILDLNYRSGVALEALRALKSNPLTNHVLVLGFISHVQTDLIAAARQAGCDQVLARSAFSEQLPQLLEKLAGKERPSAPGA